MTTQHPMVVAAARALCKRASDACNVDHDDTWKVYGESFLEDAKAVLEAINALGLQEATRRLVAASMVAMTDESLATVETAAAWNGAMEALEKVRGAA